MRDAKGLVDSKAVEMLDLTGRRFERLLVIRRRIGLAGRGKTWLCLCDCGKSRHVWENALLSGHVKSCGCLRDGHSKKKAYSLFYLARNRAKKSNTVFDLNLDDITVPKICPLLGIPLNVDKRGKGAAPDSPSIDRIDPSKGYTKDNIWVISHRANSLKSDGTLLEHQLLIKNWSKLLEKKRVK